MNMERMSVPVSMRFEEQSPVNSSFTRYQCRILALGKNQNGSYFSRDVVEAAVDKFKNIPITAFVYDGEDGEKHIAGHEMRLVERDGDYQWQTRCVPYGVIPADAEFVFEDVTEENGSVATYLTTSAILWTKKYPDIVEAAYSGDKSYWASMEIQVDKMQKLKEDERYFEILEFTPDAFTLLGKSDDPDYNVPPCFPSAGLVPYSLNEQFSTLMEEFKLALSECFARDNGGEQGTMEQEAMNQESVVVEEFSTTEEVVEEQFNSEEQPETEEVEAGVDTPEIPGRFATNNAKREAIMSAVCGLNEEDKDEYVCYYLCDFDDNYAYVIREKYSRENDEYTKSVGRVPYAMADSGDFIAVEITGGFEEMYARWLTKEELDRIDGVAVAFEQYKETHSVEDTEVEELRKFKAERLEADRRAAVNAVVEQFSDLDGNAEFNELKSSAMDMDIADFEEKCFALRGKMMKPKAKTALRVPIVKENEKMGDELYGGAFTVYGYKRGE